MSSSQSEQIKRLKRLAAINRAITMSLDRDEILDQIANSTRDLFEAHTSLVLLADSEQCLHVHARSGGEKRREDFSEPMEEAVIEKLRQYLGLTPSVNMMAVPIMSGQAVNGLLVVVGANFNNEEHWLLASLADQAAIALQNARLHEMEVNAAQRERDASLQALRDTEDRYRLMIEEVKDYAIFMISPQGNITTWNLGAERIFGFRESEILGHPSAIIFTPQDRADELPALELSVALEKGRSEDERWHIRKDGSQFWASGIVT